MTTVQNFEARKIPDTIGAGGQKQRSKSWLHVMPQLGVVLTCSGFAGCFPGMGTGRKCLQTF